MYRDKERYGQDPTKVHRSSKATFDAPLKWQREAERGDRVGHDRLVFTCSWSDWFIEEADGPWRDDAWAIIKACPLLTFQILTKRPERMAGRFPPDWGGGYPNAWGGVSVENQAAANARIATLLDTPWALRFLSVEPLLSVVDLGHWLSARQCGNCGFWAVRGSASPCLKCQSNAWVPGIGWSIVGGESGNDSGKYRARPCNLSWIRSVVEQCRAAGVPAWVKQLGSRPFDSFYRSGVTDQRINLRNRHGEDWAEFPADLRVRQMPRLEAAAHVR